ncbi:MAG: hypothetical protein HGB36_11835, partial [Chlorobiaceae bacterium]|nr:hypothetical protein [Chlorobiaceae bacterium]
MKSRTVCIGILISCMFLFSCSYDKANKKEKTAEKEKTASSDPAIKNDLTEMELKGKVKYKSESILILIDRNGEPQKSKLDYREIFNFNEKGNRIRFEYYNSDDKLMNSTAYTYDEKNNLKVEIRKDADGQP